MIKHYVYILTNKYNNVLYIGNTSRNLSARLHAHKEGLFSGFTKKYKVNKLVYYEEFNSKEEALTRERHLKNWKRQWKINLINEVNSRWQELEV